MSEGRPPRNVCRFCDALVHGVPPDAAFQAVCQLCAVQPKRVTWVRDRVTGEDTRVPYVSAYARWCEYEAFRASQTGRLQQMFDAALTAEPCEVKLLRM